MKHGAVSAGALLLLLGLCGACGYQLVYGGRPPSERLSVASSEHRVADTEAVSGVLASLRTELTRAGALAQGEGYPRVLVEVLRVDELPAGIAAPPPAPGESRRAVARGMTIAVTARAWVLEDPGSEPVVDTGDLRRLANVASQADPRIDAFARSRGVAAAAREVGQALARRILGEPEPAIEP